MSQSDIEQAIKQARGHPKDATTERGDDCTPAGKDARRSRRTNPKAEQKRAEWPLLVAISRFCAQLQDGVDERDAVATLSQCAVADLGFEDCSVYMFNAQFTVLEQWAAMGPENPNGRQLLIPIKVAAGEGRIGEVAAAGESLLLVGAEARDTVAAGGDDRSSPGSRLLVPLVYQSEVLGVIDSQDHKRKFHEERHRKALEAMAAILAVHITTLARRRRIESQFAMLVDDLEIASDLLAPIVDDVDRERLEAIRRAIGDDALRLFAQPIYQGANALRVVRAVEIFVHCDDGSESSAPAARWMPTAKKYGLLGAVDRWVFAATMQWLRERHQRLAAPVDIHVNVAVSSLLDAEYINYVEQELRAYRQAAERVVFECDDDEVYDAVRHSGAGLRAAMARLAALGCGFMLDGAGAGTVSVAQRLPFDGLKLDCGSIRADQGDGVDSLSWRYALEMSRALGMRVVFKNVIGASDLAHIESLLTDTDNLQGEYFDAAAPLTALSEALSSRAGAPLVDVRAQSNNVLPQ